MNSAGLSLWGHFDCSASPRAAAACRLVLYASLLATPQTSFGFSLIDQIDYSRFQPVAWLSMVPPVLYGPLALKILSVIYMTSAAAAAAGLLTRWSSFLCGALLFYLELVFNSYHFVPIHIPRVIFFLVLSFFPIDAPGLLDGDDSGSSLGYPAARRSLWQFRFGQLFLALFIFFGFYSKICHPLQGCSLDWMNGITIQTKAIYSRRCLALIGIPYAAVVMSVLALFFEASILPALLVFRNKLVSAGMLLMLYAGIYFVMDVPPVWGHFLLFLPEIFPPDSSLAAQEGRSEASGGMGAVPRRVPSSASSGKALTPGAVPRVFCGALILGLAVPNLVLRPAPRQDLKWWPFIPVWMHSRADYGTKTVYLEPTIEIDRQPVIVTPQLYNSALGLSGLPEAPLRIRKLLTGAWNVRFAGAKHPRGWERLSETPSKVRLFVRREVWETGFKRAILRSRETLYNTPIDLSLAAQYPSL